MMQVKRINILGERNYYQVCEEIKTGKLSKDVVVTISDGYANLLCDYELSSQGFVVRVTRFPIIHVAIGLDDQPMLDRLLALDVDIHAVADNGKSALRLAITRGKLMSVKKLLAAGADVDDRGAEFLSPLSTAVEYQYYEIAELLMSYGAPVNGRKCYGGHSPIVQAAEYVDVEMMELLIDHGADVNLLSSKFNRKLMRTPLKAACFVGYGPAVEILLNHPNIDVNIVNDRHENCLFDSVGMIPDDLEMVLDANVDVNTRNTAKKLPVDAYSDCKGRRYDQYLMLKRHIVKLMVAGFYLCVENKEAVSGKDFDSLRVGCSKEIELIKNTKELITNWSCFRILRTSQHLVALRFKNVKVPTDQEEIWIKKFPIYGKMLAFHMKKALQRKILLQRADQVLFQIFYRELPDTFIYDLYHFLSNYNLSKLLE